MMEKNSSEAKKAAEARIEITMNDLKANAYSLYTIKEKLVIIFTLVANYNLESSINEEAFMLAYERLMKDGNFEKAEELSIYFRETDPTKVLQLNDIKRFFERGSAIPIFSTIIFSLIFLGIISSLYIPVIERILLYVLYLVLHPIVGYLLYRIAFVGCSLFDSTFGYIGRDSSSYYLKKSGLIFISMWPIFGIITILASYTGALLGAIYNHIDSEIH